MFNPDLIIERNKLKKQISSWRMFAFLALILLVIAVVGDSKMGINPISQDYIARIKIDGIIYENNTRDEIIKEIAEDNNIKAVILEVNSPGGTAVGGETLYKAIKKLNDKKPVITVMHSLAASAGYLITLGSERIYAHNGTITGSIGVIMEIPNLKNLADKVGVKFDYVRTSPIKGSPTLFEEKNEAALKVLDEMMNDFFVYFKAVVAEERKLDKPTIDRLADGRIFSGVSAKKNRLIDDIGGEEEAVNWLKKNKKISKNLEVKDVKLYRNEDRLEEFLGGASESLSSPFNINSSIDAIYNRLLKGFGLML